MLQVNQSITITGHSVVNGVQVAYMSATINEDDINNTGISKNITNSEIYNANKAEVRKDMIDFEGKVYDLQDASVSRSRNKK